MNVDDEMKYTMGVYLCLDDRISHYSHDDAIPFEKIGSFDAIKENNINFIYFTCGMHKIKKKAEQIACEEALKLVEKLNN
jgi:hypothetical protein